MTDSGVELGRSGFSVGELNGTMDGWLWAGTSDVEVLVPAHGASLLDMMTFVHRNSGVVTAGRLAEWGLDATEMERDGDATVFWYVQPGCIVFDHGPVLEMEPSRYDDWINESGSLSLGSGSATDVGGAASAGTALGRGRTPIEERLSSAFDELVRSGAGETFFDGMDSVFRAQAILAIESYGDVAVHALEEAIGNSSVDIEVVEESLKLLGDVEDGRTEYSRLGVLLKALTSPIARVRDSASVGLASLGNPVAKDGLLTAMAREPSDRLRRNLESALRSL